MSNDNYLDKQSDNEVVMKKRNPVFLILGIAGIVVLSVIITVVAIKLTGSNKNSYEEKLDLGKKYLLEMNYEQAILVFEEAIKIDPKNTKAYILLSRLYEEMDEPEKAEEVLKRAETAIDNPEDLEVIEKEKNRNKEKTDEEDNEITKTPNPSTDDSSSPTSAPDTTTIPDEDEIPTATPTPTPIVSENEEKAIYELIEKMEDYEVSTTLYSNENISDSFLEFDRTSMARAAALSIGPFAGPLISGNEDEDPWMEYGFDEDAFKKAGMDLFGTELSLDDLPQTCSSGIVDAYINSDGIPVIGVCVWETEGNYAIRNTDIIANGAGYIFDKNVYSGYWGGDDGQIINSRISYMVERNNASSYGFVITGVKRISIGSDSVSSYHEPEARPEASNTDISVSGKYDFSSVKSGDTIIFGSYEQDNNPDNGKEPIEWLVLSKSQNSILVISKHALDNKAYNDTYADVSWEDCTLRRWLNNTFYSNAFGKEEKELILSAYTGDNTVDKVFLPSITYMNNPENGLNKYFSDMYNEGECIATPYAKAQGLDVDDVLERRCNLWLRSEGQISCTAAYISFKDYNNGYDEMKYSTFSSVNSESGIRPLIYINLKTTNKTNYTGASGTFGHVSDLNNCITRINYYDSEGRLRYYSVNTYYDTGYICSTTMYSVDVFYQHYGYDILDYTMVYLYDKNNNIIKQCLSSHADFYSNEWKTDVFEAYIVYWNAIGSYIMENHEYICPQIETLEDVSSYMDLERKEIIYGTPEIIPARNTDNWAKAYLDGYKDVYYREDNPTISFAYVNNDAIPELLVTPIWGGGFMFTQKNGIYSYAESYYSDIHWIRKENVIAMYSSKYSFESYIIEDGKFVLANSGYAVGREDEYEWNGVEVDYETYTRLFDQAFDWDKIEVPSLSVYSWGQCELMLKNIIERS